MNIKDLSNREPNLASPDAWVIMGGGKVNTVFRKGNLVKRRLGSWSPAVHQLLYWLKVQRFCSVPELLGVTDNEEILSFLDGEPVLRPWKKSIQCNQWIIELGTWLRHYHDAVQAFELQDGVSFIWGPKKTKQGMVVCHGDLGPWNCIQKNGHLIGVIDWDLARFGYPLDDLAQLALEAIPLRQSTEQTMGAKPDKQILWQRLELLCDSYGVYTSKDVLKHLFLYIEMISQEMQNLAVLGIQPFVSFIERGFAEDYKKDLSYIRQQWY